MASGPLPSEDLGPATGRLPREAENFNNQLFFICFCIVCTARKRTETWSARPRECTTNWTRIQT